MFEYNCIERAKYDRENKLYATNLNWNFCVSNNFAFLWIMSGLFKWQSAIKKHSSLLLVTHTQYTHQFTYCTVFSIETTLFSKDIYILLFKVSKANLCMASSRNGLTSSKPEPIRTVVYIDTGKLYLWFHGIWYEDLEMTQVLSKNILFQLMFSLMIFEDNFNTTFTVCFQRTLLTRSVTSIT